jgi:hypothetical protein
MCFGLVFGCLLPIYDLKCVNAHCKLMEFRYLLFSRLATLGALGTTISIASFAQPVMAASIFNFSKTPRVNLASETFTDAGVALTLSNSNSTGQFNNNTLNFNAVGLCAFARVGISRGRCGYGNGDPTGTISAFQTTFNHDVFVKSIQVSDFSSNFISSGTLEISTDNINFTPFTFSGATTLVLGDILLAANQSLYHRTSAVFSKANQTAIIRFNNLTVHKVPGPLGVLGVTVAFGWSRKLKKRVKLTTV